MHLPTANGSLTSLYERTSTFSHADVADVADNQGEENDVAHSLLALKSACMDNKFLVYSSDSEKKTIELVLNSFILAI